MKSKVSVKFQAGVYNPETKEVSWLTDELRNNITDWGISEALTEHYFADMTKFVFLGSISKDMVRTIGKCVQPSGSLIVTKESGSSNFTLQDELNHRTIEFSTGRTDKIVKFINSNTVEVARSWEGDGDLVSSITKVYNSEIQTMANPVMYSGECSMGVVGTINEAYLTPSVEPNTFVIKNTRAVVFAELDADTSFFEIGWGPEDPAGVGGMAEAKVFGRQNVFLQYLEGQTPIVKVQLVREFFFGNTSISTTDKRLSGYDGTEITTGFDISKYIDEGGEAYYSHISAEGLTVAPTQPSFLERKLPSGGAVEKLSTRLVGTKEDETTVYFISSGLLEEKIVPEYTVFGRGAETVVSDEEGDPVKLPLVDLDFSRTKVGEDYVQHGAILYASDPGGYGISNPDDDRAVYRDIVVGFVNNAGSIKYVKLDNQFSGKNGRGASFTHHSYSNNAGLFYWTNRSTYNDGTLYTGYSVNDYGYYNHGDPVSPNGATFTKVVSIGEHAALAITDNPNGGSMLLCLDNGEYVWWRHKIYNQYGYNPSQICRIAYNEGAAYIAHPNTGFWKLSVRVEGGILVINELGSTTHLDGRRKLQTDGEAPSNGLNANTQQTFTFPGWMFGSLCSVKNNDTSTFDEIWINEFPLCDGDHETPSNLGNNLSTSETILAGCCFNSSGISDTKDKLLFVTNTSSGSGNKVIVCSIPTFIDDNYSYYNASGIAVKTFYLPTCFSEDCPVVVETENTLIFSCAGGILVEYSKSDTNFNTYTYTAISNEEGVVIYDGDSGKCALAPTINGTKDRVYLVDQFNGQDPTAPDAGKNVGDVVYTGELPILAAVSQKEMEYLTSIEVADRADGTLTNWNDCGKFKIMFPADEMVAWAVGIKNFEIVHKWSR